MPFFTIQRQRCVKIPFPKDPEFYTPLALNCQKRQHLSALEVYKNQSPIVTRELGIIQFVAFVPETGRAHAWDACLTEGFSCMPFCQLDDLM